MYLQKDRLLPLLALTALCLSAAALGTAMYRAQPVSAALPVKAALPVEAETSTPYILRDRGGYVAVYSGEGILLRTTDAPVAPLPEADRQALQTGIPAESDEALAMLLEDLQS